MTELLTVEGKNVLGVLFKVFYVIVAVMGILAGFGAYHLGVLFNALFVLTLIWGPIMIASKIWSGFLRNLEWGFWRRPFSREMRRHLLQCASRWVFWILVGAAVSLAILPIQFSPAEYRTIRILLWSGVAVAMALELVPRKTVRLSSNALFVVGWIFLGSQLLRILLPPPADHVVLDAPFRGEWYIFHGGRSVLVNHHYALTQQRHALDICKAVEGGTSHLKSAPLESYPAFGADLFAPTDGRVIKVVKDRPDMAIGKTDLDQIVGNHVIIEFEKGRFVLMAHLMKESITVSEGDEVRRGQQIARCGNSGNTSEPHLHLQVQTSADFWAKDLRTLPILFRDVTVARGDHSERFSEADVRRNDRVFALEKKS